MFNTNKKFVDKKNVINNNRQGNNNDSFNNKNPNSNHDKNHLFHKPFNNNDGKNNQDKWKEMEKMYSKPYIPEDQYKDLAMQFDKNKFNIAYQKLQNAFPMTIRETWKELLYQNDENSSNKTEYIDNQRSTYSKININHKWNIPFISIDTTDIQFPKNVTEFRKDLELKYESFIEQKEQEMTLLQEDPQQFSFEQSFDQQQSTKEHSNGTEKE